MSCFNASFIFIITGNRTVYHPIEGLPNTSHYFPKAAVSSFNNEKTFALTRSFRTSVSNTLSLHSCPIDSELIIIGVLSIFTFILLYEKWIRLSLHPVFILLPLLLFAFAKSGQAQSQTFSSSGTFTIPAGVTSVTVECWGGGAGGSSRIGAAGGGGGGAYTKGTLSSLIPGAGLTVTVGAGGATGTNGNASSVGAISANGGLSTNSETGGAGGAASAIGGSVTASFAGGTGGDALITTTGGNNEGGGGGGGSATALAVGTNGGDATITGGNGGTGTGAGGDGADGDGTPDAVAGTAPGGGGGGRGEGASTSKAGARGQVIITWSCPTSAGTLSGASNICLSGGTTTLSSTISGGNWTSSNPSVADIHPSSGLVTAQALGGGGTVTMTYTIPAAGGCTAQTATKMVTVDNLPTVAISSASPETMCQGGTSATLGGSIGGGATGGSWSTPALGTFNPSASALNATWTPPPGYTGTATLTFTTSGGTCTNVFASKTVNVNPATPATPGVITGTVGQCPALAGQTYSISAVANATTYSWTVPTGWTITSGAGTTSITVTTGATGQNGNITVTAGNS
ncbi:MAG TPA: hypothetical protein VFG54_20035 [Prolixibacteraceae bacterium]|nr:hypothetical protein [Prolixibacteraceae bacterium]